MEHWDLRTLDVEPHQPKILHSARGEARSILINLPAGEELQEHQVHERAYVVVIDGEVDLGGHASGAGAGRGVRSQRAPRGQGDQRRAPADRARPVARGRPPGRTRRRRQSGSKLLGGQGPRLGRRRRRAGRVQQVLDAVDALDLARLGAEAVDPAWSATSPRR